MAYLRTMLVNLLFFPQHVVHVVRVCLLEPFAATCHLARRCWRITYTPMRHSRSGLDNNRHKSGQDPNYNTQELLALPREIFSPSPFEQHFSVVSNYVLSFPPNPRGLPFSACRFRHEEYEFPLCTLAVAAWILPDLILELQNLQPPPGLSEFFFLKQNIILKGIIAIVG